MNINRAGFVPTQHSRLCAKHFSPECFDTGDKNVDEQRRKRKNPFLKPRAVPTLYLRPKQQVSHQHNVAPKVALNDFSGND